MSIQPLRGAVEKSARAYQFLTSRTLSIHQHGASYSEDSSVWSHDGDMSCSLNLGVFAKAQQDGFSRSSKFLNKIISMCAKLASLSMGAQIHSTVTKVGLGSNVFVSSALVDMYGKCKVVSSAQQLFDEIPDPNVVTWNTLISAYLHAECPRTALELFLYMIELGIAPTQFSLSAVLLCCSQLRSMSLGAQVHCFGLKTGFYFDLVVGTGLINTYSKCSSVGDSRRVFDEMPNENITPWTSMITCYSQNMRPDDAMILFKEMQQQSFTPCFVIFSNLLSSFYHPAYLDHCRHVHCRVVQEGFETNGHVVASLMIAYSVCSRSSEDFYKIYSGITSWDQILWNAAISGLSHLGSEDEALKWFFEMRQAGILLDDFTFTTTLKAVGNISALEEGRHVHGLVFKAGYAPNLCVQNALVSMYARCGAIRESKRVFSSMRKHDMISWNSLLSGCASHGHGSEAIELFEQAREAGIKPDNTAFLAVLSACSHVGLLEKGLEYFDLMRNDISSSETPWVEHFACVVDMYARAGYLHEAEAFIDAMPMMPGPSVYRALISACQVHGNKEIAINAANKLLQECPDDHSTYVLVSRVLANDGLWDDAARVRNTMYAGEMQKIPGYSRI